MRESSCNRYMQAHSRRDFLAKAGFGFGSLALGYLLGQEPAYASTDLAVASNPLAPKPPHFPEKAKSVIFIFLQGGLSQVDAFDPKPTLDRFDGQPLPMSFLKGMDLGLQFIKASEAKLMASRRTFKKRGQSGIAISDLFENLARYADDLAVIRSCYHESFIHGPALSMIHTGSIQLGHPSMGAWILYGLGSVSENLPAYIVMADDYMRSSKSLERGVRFVHLHNSDWDGHAECDKNHRKNAAKTDLPIAGLLGDLKQRGLLESTLVLTTGEFGRTPVMQGKEGRDHNPYGFSVWMVGGGVQGGKVIGATDEIGFRAVEDKVHVHDLHSTMLELLGLDHKKVVFKLAGLEKRLTGVGEEGEHSIAQRLIEG